MTEYWKNFRYVFFLHSKSALQVEMLQIKTNLCAAATIKIIKLHFSCQQIHYRSKEWAWSLSRSDLFFSMFYFDSICLHNVSISKKICKIKYRLQYVADEFDVSVWGTCYQNLIACDLQDLNVLCIIYRKLNLSTNKFGSVFQFLETNNYL